MTPKPMPPCLWCDSRSVEVTDDLVTCTTCGMALPSIDRFVDEQAMHQHYKDVCSWRKKARVADQRMASRMDVISHLLDVNAKRKSAEKNLRDAAAKFATMVMEAIADGEGAEIMDMARKYRNDPGGGWDR